METGMMLVRTLAEVGVVAALIFGFIKENKVIKAERGVFRFLRSLRKRMHNARERELARELSRATYADEYRTERRSIWTLFSGGLRELLS